MRGRVQLVLWGLVEVPENPAVPRERERAEADDERRHRDMFGRVQSAWPRMDQDLGGLRKDNADLCSDSSARVRHSATKSTAAIQSESARRMGDCKLHGSHTLHKVREKLDPSKPV